MSNGEDIILVIHNHIHWWKCRFSSRIWECLWPEREMECLWSLAFLYVAHNSQLFRDDLSLGKEQLIPTTWIIFDRYSGRWQLLFCWQVLLEVVNNWTLLSDCIARYELPLPEPCPVPSYCFFFGIQWKSWTLSWCSPSERAQYLRCLALYGNVHGNEVLQFPLDLIWSWWIAHVGWDKILFFSFRCVPFLKSIW